MANTQIRTENGKRAERKQNICMVVIISRKERRERKDYMAYYAGAGVSQLRTKRTQRLVRTNIG